VPNPYRIIDTFFRTEIENLLQTFRKPRTKRIPVLPHKAWKIVNLVRTKTAQKVHFSRTLVENCVQPVKRIFYRVKVATNFATKLEKPVARNFLLKDGISQVESVSGVQYSKDPPIALPSTSGKEIVLEREASYLNLVRRNPVHAIDDTYAAAATGAGEHAHAVKRCTGRHTIGATQGGAGAMGAVPVACTVNFGSQVSGLRSQGTGLGGSRT